MKIKMFVTREIQDQGFPGSVLRLDGGVVYDLPDVVANGLINAGSATGEFYTSAVAVSHDETSEAGADGQTVSLENAVAAENAAYDAFEEQQAVVDKLEARLAELKQEKAKAVAAAKLADARSLLAATEEAFVKATSVRLDAEASAGQ